MPELVNKKVLDELKLVKKAMSKMSRELHKLREDFEDTHMSEDDRKALLAALEDEKNGDTVSTQELRQQLGL
jgi:hypothetical protein